jgi:membrane fusion protein (multidrug efflux system)
MVAEAAVPASNRWKWIAVVAVIALMAAGVWWWRSHGREDTDDAQIDGEVTPIAARVAGTVVKVYVSDNQQVDVGTVLLEIDPRDYEVAVKRARAELASAEAAARAAEVNVPIASTTATSNVSTAQGGVEQASGAVTGAEKDVQTAHARLRAVEATVRQKQAEATRASKDVERLKGLAEKREIAQQQFDAAVAAADVARAAVESAQADAAAAESAVAAAESRLTQARGTASQAHAALRTANTAPQQIEMTRAHAAAAAANVELARAALAQAELNLQYTIVKAPSRGLVSQKSVQVGQVVQAGQPLLALVSLESLWVTANFKETQLTRMRPGQSATVHVDAFPGRQFKGHVESIAGATGARFSLLPPQNATGNYVKVVQRVPVKIVFETNENVGELLRPGMSAVPTVDVR